MDQVCTCSEFTYQAAGQIAASYGTSASRSCLCGSACVMHWFDLAAKKASEGRVFPKKVIAVSSLIKTFDVYHLLEMNLQV